MTEREKQILLVDLCARLPYGVKYQDRIEGGIHILSLGIIHHYERFIPYLRPMSSMIKEELDELLEFEDVDYNNNNNVVKRAMMAFSEDKEIESNSLFCTQYARSIDWLNAHHFDYRGLIPMGLALEADKDMYK